MNLQLINLPHPNKVGYETLGNILLRAVYGDFIDMILLDLEINPVPNRGGDC